MAVSGDSGIIEGAVETTIFLNGGLDHRLDIALIRYVSLNKLCLTALRKNLPDHILAARLVDVRNRHPCACASHQQDGGRADARSAPGHNN